MTAFANPLVWISVFAASLYYILGSQLGNDRIGPNLFCGVRTRKTLTDRDAWYRANRVAGRMMLRLALPFGLLGILALVLPQQTMLPIFMTVIVAGSLVLMVAALRAQNDTSLPGAPGSTPEPPASSPDRKLPVRD